jgi:hypothetical protein
VAGQVRLLVAPVTRLSAQNLKLTHRFCLRRWMGKLVFGRAVAGGTFQRIFGVDAVRRRRQHFITDARRQRFSRRKFDHGRCIFVAEAAGRIGCR